MRSRGSGPPLLARSQRFGSAAIAGGPCMWHALPPRNVRWRVFRRFFVEDAGQDLVEYGLLTLLVLAVGVLVFAAIQASMGAAYVTWGTAILDNWEPSPPSAP
jgi:Flp pilus assembly pilin Flp